MTDDFDLPDLPDAARTDDHAFAAWAATVAGERLTEVRSEGLEGRELKDAGDLAANRKVTVALAAGAPGVSCQGV